MNSTRLFTEPFPISERELSDLVLAQMDAAVILCDKAARIVLANSTAQELYGGDPLGLHFDRAFPLRWARSPERADNATLEPFSIALVLNGETPQGLCEWDGTTPRAVYLKTAPYRGEHDEILCCIVSMMDVTETERAQRRKALQYRITDALTDAASMPQAAPLILSALCQELHWDFGAIWLVDNVAQLLRPLSVWHRATDAPMREFAQVTQQYTFARGEGIPGRVWLERKPLWIQSLRDETNFPRADAAQRADLQSAFAFPILAGGKVVGVLEAFSTANQPQDNELFEMMRVLGAQIGFFILRAQNMRELSRLAAIVQHSEDAILSKDLNGIILDWNPAAERLYGYTRDEIVGKSVALLFPPELQTQSRMFLARIREGENIHHFDTTRVRKGGTRVEVSITISPVRDETGNIVGASTVAREITERRVRERAQEFLMRATNDLSASLDFETTLQTLAQRAVPFLADWCAVHILTDDGMIRRVAFAHHDPQTVARVSARPQQYALDDKATHLVSYVLRSGQADMSNMVSAETLEQAARDDAHLETLRQLGLHAYLCLPLRARGHVRGAVTFAMSDSARAYATREMELAQELVRRASLAADNAWLYQESQAAQTRLQLVAEASSEMIASFDHEARLQRLAQLVVPRFADWCAINLVESDNSIRLAALAHTDSEMQAVIRDWAAQQPLDADAPRGTPHVIRTGKAEWVADVTVTQEDAPRAEYLERLRVQSYLILPLIARGRTFGAMSFVNSASGRRFTFQDLLTGEEIARRAALALDNAALYAQEQAARQSAERAAQRSQWLTEASHVLARSLDYKATLTELAQLVVSEFADWCTIDMAKGDGTAEQLVMAHQDPAKIEWAKEYGEEIKQYFEPDWNAPRGLPNVLRTGKPEIYYEIPDALLAQVAENEVQLEILRSIGYSSVMIVPLNVSGKTLGAITMVNTDSRRHFNDDDLAFAELFVGRAAVAIENARLYDETQQLNAELEQRVERRTAELSQAYDELNRQVVERTRAEETTRALLRISTKLNSTLDVDTSLDILIREAINAMNATSGFAGLRTANGMKMSKYYANGKDIPLEYTWEVGKGLPGWVLEHAAPYVTNDAPNDSVLLHELPFNQGVRSAICAPILDARDQVVSFLQVRDKADGAPFTGADVEFLQALAPIASIALENAQAYQKISDAESAVQQSYAQLRALAARLQTIREEERTDIARELHDELGQALTALKMDVAALISHLPARSKTLRERAQNISEQIDATIKTVRRMASQLRPGMLDDLGLAPSMEWYAQEFQTRTGIAVETNVVEEELALNHAQATALYRIFQETLTNVARHAHATRVHAKLAIEREQLVMEIADNGRGFDAQEVRGKRSLGLLGMRERAEMVQGTLEIRGAPGKGTTIVARVPLAPMQENGAGENNAR